MNGGAEGRNDTVKSVGIRAIENGLIVCTSMV